MGDLYEEARLRIENEKLRTVQDAMVKALADREAHSTRPACQVSADPALVAENKKLRDTLRECVEALERFGCFECKPETGRCELNGEALCPVVTAPRKAREVLGDE